MTNKIIFTTIIVFVLVLGVYIGASYLPQNNADKLITPTTTQTMPPTASVTPTVTPSAIVSPTPTATPKPTATTVSKSVTLNDNVSGLSFVYTLDIPNAATLASDAMRFTVKFNGGGTLTVEQVPEGYNAAVSSFKELKGKLGTYYRVLVTGSAVEHYAYTRLVTKTGNCQIMGDENVAAPCAMPVMTVPGLNFLAIMTCDGNTAQLNMCDQVMATMSIKKQ